MPADFTLSGPLIAIESLSTGRNANLVFQKGVAITEVAKAVTVTLQAPVRTSYAFSLCVVCIISLPTLINALSVQEEKWGFTKAALICLVTLKAMLITPLAHV